MPWLDFCPAQLDSKVNWLSSTRTQPSSSMSQIELFEPYNWLIQVQLQYKISTGDSKIYATYFWGYFSSRYYIYLVKVFFGFKGPDHLQLLDKNHITNFGESFLWAFQTSWLDSTQLDQGLAQLSSKHFLAKFGSTQLSSRDFWLNSAQLEKLPARTKPRWLALHTQLHLEKA